jgi:hypothetical protein
LHHIIDYLLIDALFYVFIFSSLACFYPADRRVESEPPENCQDINFKDLEHQQVGFKEKCP